MIAQPPTLICYPPAALNGGPLDTAPDKVGDWVWQPKIEDWRAVIHTPTKTVWNQYGKLSSISDKFQVALDRLATLSFAAEWLDVGLMENRPEAQDLMRGCIVVFDLIEAGIEHWARYARLNAMFQTLPVDMVTHLRLQPDGQDRDKVYLINQWLCDTPQRHYDYLRTQNARLGRKLYEGLVAKRKRSLYPFGGKAKQVTPDWIKHRFDQGGQSNG